MCWVPHIICGPYLHLELEFHAWGEWETNGSIWLAVTGKACVISSQISLLQIFCTYIGHTLPSALPPLGDSTTGKKKLVQN